MTTGNEKERRSDRGRKSLNSVALVFNGEVGWVEEPRVWK